MVWDGPGEEVCFSVVLLVVGDVVGLRVVLACDVEVCRLAWCVLGLDVDLLVVVLVEHV